MSGPSLQKLDAHRAIHEAAFHEAKELTELLQKLFDERKETLCLGVAEALIESWEQRTLAHAESEEESFYDQKSRENNGELAEMIAMLKRDHHILRTIVHDAKKLLERHKKVTGTIIHHFQALLVVVQIHSRDEEKYLLHDH